MASKDGQGSTHGSRKSPIAIKRGDGEPLTREDLQYDLLQCIFDDQHAVFTDPLQTLSGQPAGSKVTFRDLYVNALSNSPRSSKILRDKLIEVHDFATDFAKIALLTNVGRINTTMAFFPEMRTQLRTYHPIPAFYKQEGNLQDAPRIKNALKACLLDNEKRDAPFTPTEILTKRLANQVPSTSVVNLIFVMSNHGLSVARAHLYDDCDDFLDLFRVPRFKSTERCRAFLWLCFHYLESPSEPNPYNDQFARDNPGKAPRMKDNEAPIPGENIDPPDEVAWGRMKMEKRRAFVDKQQQEEARNTPAADESAGAGPSSTAPSTTATAAAKEAAPVATTTTAPRTRVKGSRKRLNLDAIAETVERGKAIASDARSKEAIPHKTSHQRLLLDTHHSGGMGGNDPYPRHQATEAQQSTTTTTASKPPRGSRSRRNKHKEAVQQISPEDYLPPSPDRTMFQHAWHIVSTTDALIDSDEEIGDHHARTDYIRRLDTLKRLRGKSPTPEPVIWQTPVVMDVDV